jgi:hypothetical protein
LKTESEKASAQTAHSVASWFETALRASSP